MELTLKQVEERYRAKKAKGEITGFPAFFAVYGEDGYCEHVFAGETWIRREQNGKFKKNED